MWRALPPPLDVLARLRAASNTTENDLKSSRLRREWSSSEQAGYLQTVILPKSQRNISVFYVRSKPPADDDRETASCKLVEHYEHT
jgi:hypothetical protein